MRVPAGTFLQSQRPRQGREKNNVSRLTLIALRATTRPGHYSGLGYGSGETVTVAALPDGTPVYAIPDPESADFLLYRSVAVMDSGDNTLRIHTAPFNPKPCRTGRLTLVGHGTVVGTAEV